MTSKIKAIVTPEWVQKKLKEKGIQQVDICKETGIERGNLSAWVNGAKPMSQPVKAMFYYLLR